MLSVDKMYYSYNDVMITPAVISEINHRSECKVLKNGMLPIFTAPMSSVVDEYNYKTFKGNQIIPIIPRSVKYEKRIKFINQGEWTALSLNEFKELFIDNLPQIDNTVKVLIDVANGHMKTLYSYVKTVKNNLGNKIQIMIGNIANPETYDFCADAGLDYVRVGIGSGSGCITSSNTGIHYPMASLLNEIYKRKLKLCSEGFNDNTITKIIADGGIRNYSDVIKALALGADYVMIGSLFSSFIESAGKTYELIDNEYHEISASNIDMIDKNYYKLFYGMASRHGQEDINGKKTKTSEGIEKYITVSGSINTWCENMKDYLRSCMSYTNIKDVHQFNATNVNCILISKNTKESINK